MQEPDEQCKLNVGLNYLSLNRSSKSLSGGEAQRIRLATQIGSELVGVLYILDEPSIGLHQSDNKRLINSLINLKDIGNYYNLYKDLMDFWNNKYPEFIYNIFYIFYVNIRN